MFNDLVQEERSFGTTGPTSLTAWDPAAESCCSRMIAAAEGPPLCRRIADEAVKLRSAAGCCPYAVSRFRRTWKPPHELRSWLGLRVVAAASARELQDVPAGTTRGMREETMSANPRWKLKENASFAAAATHYCFQQNQPDSFFSYESRTEAVSLRAWKTRWRIPNDLAQSSWTPACRLQIRANNQFFFLETTSKL